MNDTGERRAKEVPTPKAAGNTEHMVPTERSWVTYHFGLEGRLHLTLLQQGPVDGLEEGVGFDVPSHS